MKFIAYFYYIHWSHISLGLHVDILKRQVEIHLPGGFFRFGIHDDRVPDYVRPRTFGIDA